MSVEYDKNGRLHYIPKSISRSVSRDRYDDNNFSSYGLNDCEEDSSIEPLHLRTNST
ncbi:hypothetical protein WUBG_10972, partial [Wuchereria bancrofti]